RRAIPCDKSGRDRRTPVLSRAVRPPWMGTRAGNRDACGTGAWASFAGSSQPHPHEKVKTLRGKRGKYLRSKQVLERERVMVLELPRKSLRGNSRGNAG